jgi:beta-galactosidase
MLTISGDQFLLDGQPFRILSGAMHYFRIHPDYWADRLRKMRLLGLNTVETYVAWNLHEPRPGEFHFDGGLDLVRYITLAADLGLKVIVRPGPYICSEWDFGGLPAWLLADLGMRLRCAYPPYLAAVDRFFAALLPRLTPLLASQGGPIIAVQVENEYGSYGNDKTYLRHLEASLRSQGIDVLLFTSDGPDDKMLQFGTLPHLLKTANFGSRAAESFAKLRQYQPEGPLMCAEFWNGWFDHWGEPHHTRNPQEAAAALDEILSLGASVNLYMFHGGTNFRWTSGANEAPYPDYQATVTSYDDDAPLDEAGDPTPKYFAFRDVLRRYTDIPDEPIPSATPKLNLGPVALTESVGLFDALPVLATPIASPTPETMERLGHDVGFILYRNQVGASGVQNKLIVRDVHDRAQVFLDGTLLGVLEREFHQEKLDDVAIPVGGAQLDILVENMGRVNYGPNLADRKGITHGVLLGQQMLYDWQIFPLPLDDLSRLPFTPLDALDGPRFFRGTFEVANPLDTFLALPGWVKGVAWVNGFCLGRYWRRGPQQTLYIPAPLLRVGANEVILFELDKTEKPVVELVDQPVLG